MKKYVRISVLDSKRHMYLGAFTLLVWLATSTTASADENDARRLLKAMSDFMAAQTALSFNYDASLEVVAEDGQVLGLVSSGAVTMNRPNKIIATRSGGFADVQMSFDGKTFTLLGKNVNLYTQIEAPGTIDQLVDVLRDKYGRPLPGADLLLSNVNDALMSDVVGVKDLGSGVVGGVECDSLAFRSTEVDWQIWIAHGDKPYPCRYVITSKDVAGSPQYTVQTSNWKTGVEVAVTDFTFKNTTNATQVDLEALTGAGEIPEHFSPSAATGETE